MAAPIATGNASIVAKTKILRNVQRSNPEAVRIVLLPAKTCGGRRLNQLGLDDV